MKSRPGHFRAYTTGRLNLDECEDGVYGVVTCNEIRNWETGYIEEYDYMLVTADTI